METCSYEDDCHCEVQDSSSLFGVSMPPFSANPRFDVDMLKIASLPVHQSTILRYGESVCRHGRAATRY